MPCRRPTMTPPPRPPRSRRRHAQPLSRSHAPPDAAAAAATRAAARNGLRSARVCAAQAGGPRLRAAPLSAAPPGAHPARAAMAAPVEDAVKNAKGAAARALRRHTRTHGANNSRAFPHASAHGGRRRHRLRAAEDARAERLRGHRDGAPAAARRGAAASQRGAAAANPLLPPSFAAVRSALRLTRRCPARPQIDMDTIETSNLNRQFLFRRQHVGQSKAEARSAARGPFRVLPLRLTR